MNIFSDKALDLVMTAAKVDIAKAQSEYDLNQIKSKYLGRASTLQAWLSGLSELPLRQKQTVGQATNQAKRELEQLVKDRLTTIVETLQFDPIDITTPYVPTGFGHLHPISHVLDRVYRVFSELGFAIVDGPEIETDWYNFEALNQPPEHPARDMQDTFYIQHPEQERADSVLPRTQTSAMQVRFMEQNMPPFKIIVPGRVFRNEDEDRTHSWSFYQVEGLVVGDNVSLSDLKGTLNHVMRAILGEETKIRLRPSFFPYTEPSVEIDAWYRGEWLEMAGAGMVHPQVLRNAGIDSEQYSGFAFGIGAERIAMVKYGISDIRYFWRPNFEYLRQF